MISVVILSRTDRLLDRLLESFEETHQVLPEIIVADNGISDECRARHPEVTTWVPVPHPFIFSHAVNLGVAATSPTHDILVCNDDVRVRTVELVPQMEVVLEDPSFKRFGILSPRIVGGAGNHDQTAEHPIGHVVKTYKPICFVAALIRRAAWDQIGPMDERFTGYGFEDADFCRCAVEGAWDLGVIGGVEVEHGDPAYGRIQHGTFLQMMQPHVHAQMGQLAWQIFRQKWGNGPQLGAYERGQNKS